MAERQAEARSAKQSMNTETKTDKPTAQSSVGSSDLLDHSGVLGVDSTGQEWTYEVIRQKAGSEPLTGLGETQSDQHRFEVSESVSATILRRLSPSDQLRCSVRAIHQDSQPLKTFLLRFWYRARLEYET